MKRFNEKVYKKVKPLNAILKLFVHERKANKLLSIGDIRKILIVEVSLIGDEVMTIPFYSCLRANCPDAEITVIGRKWISEQLINQGLIDEIIEFDGLKCLSSPKDWIKNYKTIKKVISEANEKKYDVCFEPRGDIRYAFFMHFFNADRKISFDLFNNGYMLTDPIPEDDSIQHELLHRLSLLEKVGFDLSLSPTYPILCTTKEQKIFNDNYFSINDLFGKKIIGIHPGASLKDKQYPYYPQAISGLCERLKLTNENFAFLVFCGKGEEPAADSVNAEIEKQNMKSVVVKENLYNYIGLISNCDYMICNDSGAGHLAAAYGVPVTVVFGPVLPEMFKPLGKNSVYVVSHDLSCKPCQKRCCPLGTTKCLYDISENEIISTVCKMMKI